MKSRIAVVVSALTLGTALAATPSFAQTYNQPSGNQTSGTTAQQRCVHFGQSCSNKAYPMANSEQNKTGQNGTARSASSGGTPSGDRARLAQERERGTGDTYRLGGPNRYYDYEQGAEMGSAAPSAVESCSMRFRSFDPATGTYLGFDGIRHPCP